MQISLFFENKIDSFTIKLTSGFIQLRERSKLSKFRIFSDGKTTISSSILHKMKVKSVQFRLYKRGSLKMTPSIKHSTVTLITRKWAFGIYKIQIKVVLNIYSENISESKYF